MSSFAYVKTVLVQELAQTRVDKEVAKIKEIETDYEALAAKWRAEYETKNWFQKLYTDVEQALLEWYVWEVSVQLSWPERWRDRAIGLVAMCCRADGELVALSPEDAKFLGLYKSERSDYS